MSLTAINSSTLSALEQHAATFATAHPFPHIVIDDFFNADFCEQLLGEFPGFDRQQATSENGTIGLKAVHQHISRIGPCYRNLDTLVQSQAFLDYISAITGIPKLLHDPDYFGGGTHENLNGQELDPHVDFTFHPKLKAFRRLNLIVYLNKQWERSWGGNIEFHLNPRLEPGEDQIITVEPFFNRAVIFETNNISWHGFERICLPAEKQHLSRKSVALYFYTMEREIPIKPHSTIYVERHLPARFSPGITLTGDDVQQLRVLLKRRDQHLERLYGNITVLMQQLEQRTAMASLADKELQSSRETLYSGYNKQALLDRVLELENSTSWKITAPLRKLKLLLKQLINGHS